MKRRRPPPVESMAPSPPIPNYNTPAHVPRSLLAPIERIQRCVHDADGSMINNSHKWMEIDKKRTRVEIMGGANGTLACGRFVTVDGRHWLVEVKEVKP